MLKPSNSPEMISAEIHEYLEDVKTKPLHEFIKVIDDALKMLEEGEGSLKGHQRLHNTLPSTKQ